MSYFYQHAGAKERPKCNNECGRVVFDNDPTHAVHSSGDQVKSSLHENNDIMDREIRTNIHVDAPPDCVDAQTSPETNVHPETNVVVPYGSHQDDTRLQDIPEQDD